jgi:thymidine kinase
MFKVFGGPMFAGKTTALLNEAAQLPEGSFLFLKPSLDDRYLKDAVVSHDGQKIPAEVISATEPAFPQIDQQKTKTVFIDELNFFQYETLWPQIQKLLDQGTNVIAGGLLYDFLHQPFGATLPLSKKANQFVELFARCDNCGKPATHSYRKVGGSDQVLVGAKESYGASCQDCWEDLQRS